MVVIALCREYELAVVTFDFSRLTFVVVIMLAHGPPVWQILLAEDTVVMWNLMSVMIVVRRRLVTVFAFELEVGEVFLGDRADFLHVNSCPIALQIRTVSMISWFTFARGDTSSTKAFCTYTALHGLLEVMIAFLANCRVSKSFRDRLRIDDHPGSDVVGWYYPSTPVAF